MKKVSDINILETSALPAPVELKQEIRKSEQEADFVSRSRTEINRIIFGDDKRFLVVIGPCSIHDIEAGMEYGRRLKALSDEVRDRICLVMRVYFEKPRTTVGWKGLIMDPKLDGTCDIVSGLKTARKFLRSIIDLEVPTATELLDPITPQYIADLISWSAIGARTTESQTHRQMASGLSMPLGFKNGTDGNVTTAINAIKAARSNQTFLGINHEGAASAVTTAGNPHCHLILRGGRAGTNYDVESIRETEELLEKAGLPKAIMVDCSHANSGKDPQKQPEVAEEVFRQIEAGNTSIIGLMVESNLKAGNQPFPQPKENLKYGVSITDGCIDWPTTEKMIRRAYEILGPRFASA
ncbi:MAG TPA: 3-deoxy-7-phosphoheptulonate synthase [Opitutales bacterium]|nr:3-deoxy-7-phosphoheptulonate synthase [Opitutales bacterium]